MSAATAAFDIPFDTFWVDAGWYGAPEEVDQSTNCGPFWYRNAGMWHPNTVIHPDGNLRKVSDAARAWAVEEVSRNIREGGVDIYRQDFNMDPLDAWRDNDAPDRMGVNEIMHINGLYAFWDELQRRFPDLAFENCASGGTRMDIEMMSRSSTPMRI